MKNTWEINEKSPHAKPATVARGPILDEISYALTEITEIKFEIAKSSSLREITS